MQTRGIVVSLVVLAVCLMAAAPSFAQAVQPAPKSYVAIDPNGSILECFDFNKSGVVWAWSNGRKGNFQTMDISGYTGTPADSLFWGQIQNVFFEGVPVTKLQFTGTCEQQGGAWWGFGGSWGNAACGLTSYMRGTGCGNFNTSNGMIQVGPVFGNCTGLFGGARPVPQPTSRNK